MWVFGVVFVCWLTIKMTEEWSRAANIREGEKHKRHEQLMAAIEARNNKDR